MSPSEPIKHEPVAPPDETFKQSVSELANALQAALLIAAQLDADRTALLDALTRAVQATKHLQPKEDR